MSWTRIPPDVRISVSRWKIFIVEAILRESLPDEAVEPAHPVESACCGAEAQRLRGIRDRVAGPSRPGTVSSTRPLRGASSSARGFAVAVQCWAIGYLMPASLEALNGFFFRSEQSEDMSWPEP